MSRSASSSATDVRACLHWTCLCPPFCNPPSDSSPLPANATGKMRIATTEEPLDRYFNDSPPSGDGSHGENLLLRQESRQPAGLRKLSPVDPHLLDRHLRVTRLQVDPTNRIAEHSDRQAPSESVERRRPHAVVRRQSANEQLIALELVQCGLQIPSVVRECLEPGVGVLLRIHPFREDERRFRENEVRMEPRALRPLDAMRRPCAAKFLEVLRLPRMPISREEDWQAAAFEEGNRLVDARDDRIAVRHAEGPTRAEIVLDVDDQERGPPSHGPVPTIPEIR